MDEAGPTTLHVIQSPDQRAEVDADSVVVVQELLEAVPVPEYDEVYGAIRHASLPAVAGVALYEMLWQRFAVPFNGFPDEPTGISHLIVLYRELASLPGVEDVEVVDCHGLDPSYRAVVADFARNEGIERAFDVRARRHRVAGFLRGLLSLLVVLVDGVLSLLLRYRFDYARSADVVFVPHLNRFDAMRPVIEAADYDHQVVAPVSTIEWLYHRARGRWSGPAAFSPVPVGAYTSIRIIRSELALVARLVVEELFLARFTTTLRKFVQREFGMELDHAVSRALGNAYPANLGPIPNLWLAERLYRISGADGVVVGSLSLRQQTFLFAADAAGIDSYHVPHTVPTHYDTVPKTDTEHFVPSENAHGYHEDAAYLWRDGQSIVPTGRPLLTSLADRRPPADPVTEPIEVVVATQPFEDRIRREFVSRVVDRLDSSPQEFSIVVKTHPVEDPGFYADFEAGREDLRVTDADLYERLASADLTVVVNTNVGLESVALGTPTVAVNLWEPFVNARPYQERGPIPLVRSPEELDSFVDRLDPATVEELRDEQVGFFEAQYGGADVAEGIARYVHGDRPTDATFVGQANG